MALIEYEKKEGIAYVTMNNGGNAHNLEFSKELNQILDQVAADPDVNAMILTSSDAKSFSVGIDVDWISKRFQEKDSALYFGYMGRALPSICPLYIEGDGF